MLATFMCSLLLLAFFLANFLRKRRASHRLFTNIGIPGPTPSILLGNSEALKPDQLHKVISSWLKKYGDIFGYFLGDQPLLVVKDLDLLKRIMFKDFDLFCNRPFTFDLSPFDLTLIFLKDKRWYDVRSILSRSFTTGKIKLMSEIIHKKVNITVDIIEKKAANNEIFEIYELFQGLSLDVIAECALTMKTHCQEHPKNIFFNSVRNNLKKVDNGIVKLVLLFPFTGILMKHLYKFSTNGQMTRHILDNLSKTIAERRENPEIKKVDFLQLMMENREDENRQGNGITDEEILANLYVFLVAGFETKAKALSFTIDLLIKHPDIQERLYQEIAEAEDDSYHAVQSLPYLDQVIKESLRIHPPVVTFVSRQSNTDYQAGSIIIPKGTVVLAPVWDIHHDPDLWPDPWKFDPDRFSPENKKLINSMAYMPFGLGKRNCIGLRLATSEVKLVIFRLLAKFKFETCEKTEDPVNLENGIYLRALPRSVAV